jgi:PAS domain-containing protein
MLAEDIDFHEIFRIHPTAMVLLTADFVILDANEAFLDDVGRPLEEIVGHNVFAEFPKMPEEPGGDPKWTALEAAATSGQCETCELTRYDFEDPQRPGVFSERYWSSVVRPIRDRDGRIEYLELSGLEMTPVIAKYQALQHEYE